MPAPRSWLLATLLAACATAPPPVQDPEATLAQAEQARREGDAARALALVAALEPKSLPRRLRDRREWELAKATLLTGDPWGAYRIAERFTDLYPHSELRAKIAELEFDCACALIKRDGGFLFFYSDRRGARTALEHLITRHPGHDKVPDALRLLGDMAFLDREYTLAQERYRDLMRRYPDNEWVVSRADLGRREGPATGLPSGYARFQYAMSIVAGLQGPDYDLDQMELATRELRDFLRAKVENPDFVKAATDALERLLEWRAERHLRIADFYDRIDNPPGRRLHLEMASTEELAETAAAAKAREQLAALAVVEPATAEGGR